NPMRLASPTTLEVTRIEISSRPLVPLLMTQTMSKARSDSITVTTMMMMVGPEDQGTGDSSGGRAHVQDHRVPGGDHGGGVDTDAGLLERGLPLRRFEGPLPEQPRGRHGPAADPPDPRRRLQGGQVGPDRDRGHPEPVGQVGDPGEPLVPDDPGHAGLAHLGERVQLGDATTAIPFAHLCPPMGTLRTLAGCVSSLRCRCIPQASDNRAYVGGMFWLRRNRLPGS